VSKDVSLVGFDLSGLSLSVVVTLVSEDCDSGVA
jgi:hypothetical protein